jgi:transcriptional regulator with XRE-family HTH domain
MEEARLKLGLSQTKLAQQLGVKQAHLSRWENGHHRPDAKVFIKLARLMTGEDRRFFWNLAGVDHRDIAAEIEDEEERLWKAPEIRLAVMLPKGSSVPGGARLKEKPDLFAIPLLKDSAAAGSPRIMDEQIEYLMYVDPLRAPHGPEYTRAFKVKGSSMEPSLRDGYTVVVDIKERDPSDLVNAMVVARDPEGKITVKYLRRVQGEFVLVAEHTSVEYDPVLLSREPGWKILGKVLWWIGEPRQFPPK